jgi:dTMP kinase
VTVGLLVEIVGIDGAGKTTVVRQVCGSLGATPRKVAAYSEEFHAFARRTGERFGPRAEAGVRGCAVATALVAEAGRPRSGIDVFDRYLAGARMFFAVHALTPLPEEVLAAVPQPDLVVLLDVPVEVGLARRVRPSAPDLDHERDYLRACAEYLRATAARDGWLVVDARAGLDDVITETAAAIRALAPGRAGGTVRADETVRSGRTVRGAVS